MASYIHDQEELHLRLFEALEGHLRGTRVGHRRQMLEEYHRPTSWMGQDIDEWVGYMTERAQVLHEEYGTLEPTFMQQFLCGTQSRVAYNVFASR